MEFALETVKDNDEEVKRVGIELGVKMCTRLLEAGVPGVHLYTLNLEKAAVSILEKLGLLKGRVGLWLVHLSFLKELSTVWIFEHIESF